MKQAPRLPQWPHVYRGMARWFRWHLLMKPALLLVTTGVLTMLVFLNLDIYQVGASMEQFRLNAPAPRDILASRAITWVDIEETRRRRDDAASRVPTQYVKDQSAQDAAQADLEAIFGLLRRPLLSPAERQKLDEMHIPPDLIDATRSFTDATWDQMLFISRSVLSEVMEAPLKEGRDEQRAYHQIDAFAAMRETQPLRIRVVSTVARAAFHPVYRIDEKATDLRRDEERKRVSDAVILLKRNDIVVRKGQIITPEILAQLKDKRLLSPAPPAQIIPIAALMLFSLAMLGVYLRAFCRPVYERDRKLLLLACLIVAPLWANMTLGRGQDPYQSYLVGLMAIPAGTMAVAGLLGAPVATVTAMLSTITAGLTADLQFPMVLLLLGSSLTGIMAVSAIWPASRAIPAVLALVVVNLGLVASLECMRPGGGLQWMLAHAGTLTLVAGAGGVGATFIAIGAIYMLARPFGITTHYRLMELSNPNEPLLRRMQIEAPGSYHSSVMVANMAEAAADAVGANPLLTRVAALYHDIGKLKRPAFFVENQAPLGLDNVHQRLSPRLSYLILSSHVRDGVEMGRRYKLPEEVIHIIGEHHGTTLAAYFYHRALNEAASERVSEHDFRYPGPKPSSREAAVVMLADSVQAAVKAIKEPTPSRIEHMVQEIINNRLQDGQLEECEITLRDLHHLSDVFVRMLSGLYTYTRLEYPDLKNNARAPSQRLRVREEAPPEQVGSA